MQIEQLLMHRHAAIQCHDSPDADAIAAGYGMYAWFKSHGVEARLFYGGEKRLTKPNLVKMLDLLHIPLEHVPEQREWPSLLLTVDCQYGAGNVSPMAAQEVAVLDHHIIECQPPGLYDIRPFLGSCSTLVWALLRDAGFKIETRLATALFYGLFTDTGGLAEVRHPLDRDLRDSLNINERILKILRNSNLSLHDLTVASAALRELSFNAEGRFALVRAQTEEPNILGFVSDLIMQVDNVDIGLVYSEVSGGIKYSVRTLERDSKASHIATWLCAHGLGSGGGHDEKAGGYISGQNFRSVYPGLTPGMYFNRRLREYLAAYAIIDYSRPELNRELVVNAAQAAKYEKLPVTLAYVSCAEVFPQHTVLHIRMREGDISIQIDDDTYLMIGLQGEVYPISRHKFESVYTPCGETPKLDFEYPPVVLEKDKGARVDLASVAKACYGSGGGRVVALPLRRGLKLFTRWDADNYIKGEPGDWLVWPDNEPSDLYVVTAQVFPRLYRPARQGQPAKSAGPEDYTGVALSTLPGAVRACKKEQVVRIDFASGSGIVQTLEGPVPYAPGDAIVTGSLGEQWPVTEEYLQLTYTPADGQAAGKSGKYAARPLPVTALRPNNDFYVALENGAVLRGGPGDWLVQYANNDYGLVKDSIFNVLYDVEG